MWYMTFSCWIWWWHQLFSNTIYCSGVFAPNVTQISSYSCPNHKIFEMPTTEMTIICIHIICLPSFCQSKDIFAFISFIKGIFCGVGWEGRGFYGIKLYTWGQNLHDVELNCGVLKEMGIIMLNTVVVMVYFLLRPFPLRCQITGPYILFWYSSAS